MLNIKKIFIIITVLTSMVGCVKSSTTPEPQSMDQPLVIGYYPSWAAARGVTLKNAPFEQLTHINYAFSNVSEEGECILGDPTADVERLFSAEESINDRADNPAADFHSNFNQFLEMKKKYPKIKVLISIGGWSWSENFSNAASNKESRQRFASSCINLYLKQYAGVFDGLDIDWEYPVSGGMVEGSPEDKANFTLLLQEVRQQLDEQGKKDGRDYLLTIAAPVGPGNIRNLDLPGIARQVDWINLMTYDFHGTWDTTTNFNAPLYRSDNDPADASLNVDAAVQTYLAEGVPAEKLVLGVPFYGRGWSGVADVDNGLYQPVQGAAPGTHEAGAYEYNDLRDNYLTNWKTYWSDSAFVPWLYDPESQVFISYDDARSLEAKAGYAKDNGLAGVMIWEISQGDKSLVEAIYQGFENGGPVKPTPMPKVFIPRPFEIEIHMVENITIDGQLTDWPMTPNFILDKEEQVVFEAASDSWSGPDDLSTEAWTGWDQEGLFFAFAVTDDFHVQSAADETLWHGDHMEIQLDTRFEDDYDNPGMNGDDFQIGISIGNGAEVQPIAYAWFNGENLAGELTGVKMVHTPLEDGYIVELFIPAASLSGISLEEGAVFGMNISPSDSDRAGSSQEVMLSTSTIRTYADPRTFGKITLTK